MSRLVAAALSLALVPGCVTALELDYAFRGHHRTVPSPISTELPAPGQEAWRQIAYDPRAGLVCTDMVRPYMHELTSTTHFTYPKGNRTAMQVLTLLDAIGLTLAIGLVGPTRKEHLLWLVPAALDVGWGTYRSFTLPAAVVRGFDVTSKTVLGGELAGSATPCPPGTLVTLTYGRDLTVAFGPDGLSEEDRKAVFDFFQESHGRASLRGDGELDLSCWGDDWWLVRPKNGWKLSSGPSGKAAFKDHCPL